MHDLAAARSDRKRIQSLLTELCGEGLLSFKAKKYHFEKNRELVEGVVEMHPRGFGFARLETAGAQQVHKTKQDIRKDPFISPASLGGANHGDRVLLRVVAGSRGRPEARVVRVLERVATRLVGIYTGRGKTGFVIPTDERFGFRVVVPRPKSCGARTGDAVSVEITDFKARQPPEGRIVEILGDPADVSVQLEMVIRKYGLPVEFSTGALQDAEQFPDECPAAGREDLRGIPHVTIDGETARDFDDAVSVSRIRKGFRLVVSIADVSHYVQPGSVLDHEAYERGTSVYFPGRVVPMLPERLSNHLCSLVPGQDRAAFTAVLDFDSRGRRVAKEFRKSIIRSRHRLTYTAVKGMLVDGNRKLREQYSDVVPSLELMAELAMLLADQRTARGSIGFSLPEPVVMLDDDGEVTSIKRSEHNLAHRIIEEFMLAANEAVAETFVERRCPALYRIHERPDVLKVSEFVEFARVLGLPLSGKQGTPSWFGGILNAVADTPREYIVNNLLLRTMQRARYSPENVGHFGLAATHYTHFTSPIRRYPDLMVHRALAQLLPGSKAQADTDSPAQPVPLAAAGDFLSARERVAMEAEREMADVLQARFMAGREGEVFDCIISGVSAYGLHIELVDHFVSGGVAMADLDDDYYFVDEKAHSLVGRHSNRTYQLGDKVCVRLSRVDLNRKRIHFALSGCKG